MLPASQNPAAGEQGRGQWELSDIFREYGESYRRAHRLSASHLKVMRAIETCRTAELGGHLEKCDCCDFERPAYNSCRNRHCPKCRSLAKARWLFKQNSELLPTGYFHLVFTLTHELNCLVLAHKRVLLNILFQAVSETLLEFGHTHLRGTVGFIAVLHTWDQLLKDHFHLHCLIPAGALSSDESRWVKARKNFLFRVEPLSRVFRGKFLYLMKKAIRQGKLPSPPPRLSNTDWVVYAKKPFASPQQVLDYLGRYTHRVAISNHRIICAKDGQVTFTYRDRRDEDRLKTKTLDAQEFIRRFLLHILPDGFVRVRHFGFLANRSKKQALARCRELLGARPSNVARKKSTSQNALGSTIGGSRMVFLPPKSPTFRLLGHTPRPRSRSA